MKNKYKFKNTILVIILIFAVLTIVGLFYFLSPVGGSSKDIEFVVTEGEGMRDIAKSLKEEDLIKNEKVFLVYTTIHDKRKVYAATYELNKKMSLRKIVNTLNKGGKNSNEFSLTFKEGLNMKGIAKEIAKNTNNRTADVYKVANDEEYINSLINKYWFITKDVKKSGIYYNLEGYLFPDTYNFLSKDVTVKEIFDEMIKRMDEKLTPYKSTIEKSKYSPHGILTMASILELEALDETSRSDVAGVFYNRLKAGMPLGSDVTTYYGAKKDMNSDLTESELNSSNGYNTRNSNMAGKLPVGPICNPGIESIVASINPTKHKYYYFVADKNGKVYLTKTNAEHERIIRDLKTKDLWLEW